MKASRPSWIFGSGTLSQRMSHLPCHFIVAVLRFVAEKKLGKDELFLLLASRASNDGLRLRRSGRQSRPGCGVVSGAQAVEHYEICRYGTLIAWAEKLGHDEVVRFLTSNLNEEKRPTPSSIRSRFERASTPRRRTPRDLECRRLGLRRDGLGVQGTKPNIAG